MWWDSGDIGKMANRQPHILLPQREQLHSNTRTNSLYGTWDTTEAWGLKTKELGGLWQLKNLQYHRETQRKQKIMCSWQRKPVNSSHWELTCTNPKNTYPFKRTERPSESLVRLIGEGLLVWSKYKKTRRVGYFFKCVSPNTKFHKMRKNKETWFNQRNKINLQKSTLKKEVHELPDKEFKITAIKIFNELRKTMCEQNENINQEKY